MSSPNSDLRSGLYSALILDAVRNRTCSFVAPLAGLVDKGVKDGDGHLGTEAPVSCGAKDQRG